MIDLVGGGISQHENFIHAWKRRPQMILPPINSIMGCALPAIVFKALFDRDWESSYTLRSSFHMALWIQTSVLSDHRTHRQKAIHEEKRTQPAFYLLACRRHELHAFNSLSLSSSVSALGTYLFCTYAWKPPWTEKMLCLMQHCNVSGIQHYFLLMLSNIWLSYPLHEILLLSKRIFHFLHGRWLALLLTPSIKVFRALLSCLWNQSAKPMDWCVKWVTRKH